MERKLRIARPSSRGPSTARSLQTSPLASTARRQLLRDVTVQPNAKYTSTSRRKATQKPVLLTCTWLHAEIACHRQGPDQKRQAFSKRKRGIVLKVFMFVVNDKGASWSYASPGFHSTQLPEHLMYMREKAGLPHLHPSSTEVMPHPGEDEADRQVDQREEQQQQQQQGPFPPGQEVQQHLLHHLLRTAPRQAGELSSREVAARAPDLPPGVVTHTASPLDPVCKEQGPIQQALQALQALAAQGRLPPPAPCLPVLQVCLQLVQLRLSLINTSISLGLSLSLSSDNLCLRPILASTSLCLGLSLSSPALCHNLPCCLRPYGLTVHFHLLLLQVPSIAPTLSTGALEPRCLVLSAYANDDNDLDMLVLRACSNARMQGNDSGSDESLSAVQPNAKYTSTSRRKATQKPVLLTCTWLHAEIACHRQGPDQKRQAFSKRKRGIVLKVFMFVVNDKGASWSYASPGFHSTQLPEHLMYMREKAGLPHLHPSSTEVMPHPGEDEADRQVDQREEQQQQQQQGPLPPGQEVQQHLLHHLLRTAPRQAGELSSREVAARAPDLPPGVVTHTASPLDPVCKEQGPIQQALQALQALAAQGRLPPPAPCPCLAPPSHSSKRLAGDVLQTSSSPGGLAGLGSGPPPAAANGQAGQLPQRKKPRRQQKLPQQKQSPLPVKQQQQAVQQHLQRQLAAQVLLSQTQQSHPPSPQILTLPGRNGQGLGPAPALPGLGPVAVAVPPQPAWQAPGQAWAAQATLQPSSAVLGVAPPLLVLPPALLQPVLRPPGGPGCGEALAPKPLDPGSVGGPAAPAPRPRPRPQQLQVVATAVVAGQAADPTGVLAGPLDGLCAAWSMEEALDTLLTPSGKRLAESVGAAALLQVNEGAAVGGCSEVLLQHVKHCPALTPALSTPAQLYGGGCQATAQPAADL
ncbi:hypothetical protein QJQ45_013393 [Haematococcus lacustris]|nr:hypothetical protein QJQ45_013393 [Haematococcus lacustris]